jgi:hypothetical protein
MIDLDSGILLGLMNKKLLSSRDADEIANTLYDKSDKFMYFLTRSYDGDYCEILGALTENGQVHVANCILSAGGMFQLELHL